LLRPGHADRSQQKPGDWQSDWQSDWHSDWHSDWQSARHTETTDNHAEALPNMPPEPARRFRMKFYAPRFDTFSVLGACSNPHR